MKRRTSLVVSLVSYAVAIALSQFKFGQERQFPAVAELATKSTVRRWLGIAQTSSSRVGSW